MKETTQTKKPTRKHGKTRKLLQKQTVEQNHVSSEKINHIVTVELKKLIDYNIRRYRKTFELKLGMNDDDIQSDIMFQVWKGLVTFNKKKKANIKTYISRLITNRFRLLAKKSCAKKYSIISYVDYNSSDIPNGPDHENCETLLQKREEILMNIKSLVGVEKQILLDLMAGTTLKAMVEKNNIQLPKLIGIIKKIEQLILSKKEDFKNVRY